MHAPLFKRRSATTVLLYASVGLGFLGMVVAARVLGKNDFGVFATALAAVGFFQILLDVTVEESLTKYGFRYISTQEWGRLRRLFRVTLVLKLLGGALATAIVLLLAPFGDRLFGEQGVGAALLAAALLPLAQAPENVGATALLLHSRYDLRGFYQAGAAGLRCAAIVIGVQYGVDAALAAIVVAQVVSTAGIVVVGRAALRRFPHAPARSLGEDVPGIRSFVLQSSLATGVISLRTTFVPVVLGIVSSTAQVALFRIAQTPQTGLAAVSAPARLVLLTEQTRDWERGRRQSVFEGVRKYTFGAGALMLVAVPVFFFAMPFLVRVVFGEQYEGAVTASRIILLAAAIQFAIGWTKSLPVTVGQPRLRIVTHGLETIVIVPLVALLGAQWGVTGAAVAVLASTLVFAAAWGVALARLRVATADPSRLVGGTTP